MNGQSVLDRAAELPGAKRYDKYVACLCPFHGDTLPSLMVYPDRFRCLACGASGKPDKLFAESSFLPSVTKQVESWPVIPRSITPAGLALRANREVRSNTSALEYLKERGIYGAVNQYRVGYWDGWFTVPIYTEADEITNVMFRASRDVEKRTGRRFFQLVGRAGQMMYVPDWSLLDTEERIFITFGLFDAITLALLGYAAVTTNIGQYNFNPNWLSSYRKPIVIVPDKGERPAANLLCSRFGDWRVRVLELVYPRGCKDPNDFVYKARKPELLMEQLEKA